MTQNEVIRDRVFETLLVQTEEMRRGLPSALDEPMELVMRGSFDFGWESVMTLLDEAALATVMRKLHRYTFVVYGELTPQVDDQRYIGECFCGAKCSGTLAECSAWAEDHWRADGAARS